MQEGLEAVEAARPIEINEEGVLVASEEAEEEKWVWKIRDQKSEIKDHRSRLQGSTRPPQAADQLLPARSHQWGKPGWYFLKYCLQYGNRFRII